MTTQLHRRGLIAIVFALVAAACASTATDTTEATTTTTTAGATTTSAPQTITTTVAETTTTVAKTGSGSDAIIDAALPYVSPGGPQYEYSPVQDNGGNVSTRLPSAWDDIDGEAWIEDGKNLGSQITAADNIDAFYSDFSAPGIFIGSSASLLADLGPDDNTDEWDYSASCTLTDTVPVSTGSLDGQLAVWTDCGETDAALLTFVAVPPTDAQLVVAVAIVLTEADVEAYVMAIDAFSVTDVPVEAMDTSQVVDLVAEYVGGPEPDPGVEVAEVRDDTDTLTMIVPATWIKANSDPWTVDGADVGLSVTATPDFTGFAETWTTPGVWYGSSEDLAAPDDVGALLDTNPIGGCTYSGRYSFEGTLYVGAFDLWSECGGTDSVYFVLEAYRPDKPYVAFLEILIASPEDLVGLERILDSFDVLRQS